MDSTDFLRFLRQAGQQTTEAADEKEHSIIWKRRNLKTSCEFGSKMLAENRHSMDELQLVQLPVFDW